MRRIVSTHAQDLAGQDRWQDGQLVQVRSLGGHGVLAERVALDQDRVIPVGMQCGESGPVGAGDSEKAHGPDDDTPAALHSASRSTGFSPGVVPRCAIPRN